MSITDELRKWASVEVPYKYGHQLTAIADRIDAEHEQCINAMWEDAKSHLSDESLTEHGWIRLPKDADGEYIHIGEVMEFSAFEVGKPPTRMVDGIGQGVFFAWCGERGYQQHEAKRYRHYHAPTVEDVLAEFFEQVGDGLHTLEAMDTQLIIAEYAAKLQLKEDE